MGIQDMCTQKIKAICNNSFVNVFYLMIYQELLSTIIMSLAY